MRCSWSSNHTLVTKHNRPIKAARKDGPEMKHIPLSLGLRLQKRKGKFICAGVKPYSPSSPTEMRSKASRLSSSPERAGIPRSTSDTRNPGGNWRLGSEWGCAVDQGEMRHRMMENPSYPSGLELPQPLLSRRDGGGPQQRYYSSSIRTHAGGGMHPSRHGPPSPAVRGARNPFGKPWNTAPGAEGSRGRPGASSAAGWLAQGTLASSNSGHC